MIGGAKSGSVSKNESSEIMFPLPTKILQKQKERKYVVVKGIRSFFGGSTIVKLNSKEKKVIKIDWRTKYIFFKFQIGFIA